jgi:hypothetical protein
MRELSLQDLHAELLRIAVRDRPSNQRFEALLQAVRIDLKRRLEWRTAGMEPDRKVPLSDWWAGYPELSRYIDE